VTGHDPHFFSVFVSFFPCILFPFPQRRLLQEECCSIVPLLKSNEQMEHNVHPFVLFCCGRGAAEMAGIEGCYNVGGKRRVFVGNINVSVSSTSMCLLFVYNTPV
jgi:hypothetical protein